MDGVELNVTQGGDEVHGVEHAGVEATLPQATGAGEAAVEVLGILGIDGLNEFRNAIRLVGAGNEVEMIGHEAIGEDINFAALGVTLEEGEEVRIVAVGEEGLLAVVTALGNVEPMIRRGKTGFAGHTLK